MQRYRVNYLLMGILAISTLVLSGAAYGLWSYQVDRNAAKLLERADANEADGDLIEARRNLEQYVRLRRDDEEARIRLATVANDIANGDNATPDDMQKAYALLNETVARTEDPELTRKLIELHLRYGRPQDALQSVDLLLEAQPDDPELQTLKARCLYFSKDYKKFSAFADQLIGYDPVADDFDADKAIAPQEIDVYALLVNYLVTIEHNEKLTNRVIDQMVVANPENFKAHLLHYEVATQQLRRETARTERETATLEEAVEKSPNERSKERAQKELEEKEEQFAAELKELGDSAEASLAKAYELAPEEESVLLAKGQDYVQKEEYDKAVEFFERGKKQFPENVNFDYRLAQCYISQEDYDEARKILSAGLAEFGIERAFVLARMQIPLLLQEKDYEPVEKLIKELNRSKLPIFGPVAEYYQARLLQTQGKYDAAIVKFKKVRPLLAGFYDLQLRAGIQQAQCHYALSQKDLARGLYFTMAQSFPENAFISKALAQLDREIGRGGLTTPTKEIDRLVDQQLALPSDQQDWKAVQEFIDKIAEEKEVTPARHRLLEAQVFAKRKMWQEAQDSIREAFEEAPDDLSVNLAIAQLLSIVPDKGPAVALKSLDRTVKKLGDSINARILRIAFLTRIYAESGDEAAFDQIAEATDNMDEWSADQQATVWKSVAQQYRRLKKYDDAWDAVSRAIQLVPDSRPLYEELFETAQQQRDDAKMLAAEARFLEVTGSKTSPEYLLMDVKRIITGVSAGKMDKAELDKARRMIKQALKERDTWSDLYVAQGKLQLLADNDYAAALNSFDKAFKYGRTDTNVLVLQVRLLAEQGRFQEAYERMQLLPAAQRTEMLGRTEAEVLKNIGEEEQAFASAESLAEKSPNDVDVQLWFAEMALAAEKNKIAENAVDLAASLQPSDPSSWMKVIGLYQKLKQSEKIEHAFREAQLALDANYIPLLTAKFYEGTGRWQAAENIYQTIWKNQFDEPATAHNMGDFYLRWVKADAENLDKAKPYINRVLRAAYEGKITFDDPNAVWALKNATSILAQAGDYQNSLRAEKLLTEAYEAADKKETYAALLADVLSTRSDPASWLRAVKMFQDLKEKRGLTKSGDIRLGGLLFQVGEWQDCKRQMEEVISRYPQDVKLRVSYIDMLIKQREFKEADTWLARVKELDPNGQLAVEFRARLAAAQDRMSEVRSLLTSITPDLSKLTREKLESLLPLSDLAQRVSDYEYAGKLLETYLRYQKSPDPAVVLRLATLQGMHFDAEQSLATLAKLYPDNPDEVMRTAISILRKRRAEYGDKLDAAVDKMVEAALRDDPESTSRLIARAETLEIEKKYDEAMAAYQSLLDRDDLNLTLRATTLNNLAYLYALSGKQAAEALQYVNEAIDLIGPLSDVLDTRAVIYIADAQGAKAAEDMQMAIRMNPTPGKYFHLAQAQLLAGNPSAAIAAWDRGVAEGLTPEEVSELEQKGYAKAAEQIEAIRSSNVKL